MNKKDLESIRDIISTTFDEYFEKFSIQIKNDKEDQYLSRNETCQVLKINPSTLHRWDNKGVTKRYFIEGRTYYKQSEINNLFESLNVA